MFALLIANTITSGMSVPLTHLQEGRGTVHYFHPPNVVLDLRLVSGKTNRIPLSYEEIGQQRRAEIWNATVLAEDPGHFLIFMDRFSSNANVQGECGASDGERYLHVVKLTAPVRETLSLNIDSCYRSLSTVDGYPKYDSLTHILVIRTEHEDTSVTSVSRYRIATNGSVELIQ
ncbi:MAG TPA: hypothetical protein VJV22_06165 [Acidobacteriaceae bacterium]|nr:hypothetical protein [Acidobacteriaceae bacterium]